MKKFLALMLTVVMCLSLCACGGNSEKESMEATQNAQELEIPVSQFIAERINQTLNSKAFADWQQRYEDFTGKRPNNNPYVENAIRYQIDDIEGAKIDCYLLSVKIDVAYWINEEAQQGMVADHLYFYIDTHTGTTYDNISINAGNSQADLTTEVGRASYLVGFYADTQENNYETSFANDSEVKTPFTPDELEAISKLLLITEATENGATESTEEAVTEAELNKTAVDSKQLIIDSLSTKINSEEFAAWEDLYMQFMGVKTTKAPRITNITHYEIEDFDGAKMDCYLITVDANLAHWINEEAEQGSVDNYLHIFVDANTATMFDSITTDALGCQHDTATEQGRATYLMWIHAGLQDGSYNGNYLSDTEIVTEMSEAEIDTINDALTSE